MLSRLRITQRLSLLLMLPLAAVVLISVPFTVERVDDARAAAAIVNSAHNARAIGSVIQELQQERLLALAYLASPRVSRSAVVAQAQSTVDAADQARRAVTGSATVNLTTALAGLDGSPGPAPTGATTDGHGDGGAPRLSRRGPQSGQRHAT